MQFRNSLALVACLLTSEVLAACPPNRHRVSPSPSPYPVTTTTATSSPAPPVTYVVATSSTSAAASATPSSSSSGLSADETNALATQNEARDEVGEAPLTWDTTLAADAASWAATLVADQGSSPGTLTHSSGTGQGENLYWQSDSTTPFENAAAAWVAEKSSYPAGTAISTGSAFESYGHYTQIIWDSTTAVGMGIASDGQGGYYVVARYTPAGNVIGEVPTSS